MRSITVLVVFCISLIAQPLRDLADRRGIRIGAAVNPAHLSEALYADTLAREFNQIEAENAMKFGPIHPAPESYNFGPVDTLIAFAHEHHMAIRGHNFVWHRQNPAWLAEGKFSPEQLSSILQAHIKTVASHCAGQVYAWDVVNEAFNDDGSFRSTVWSDSPGIGRAGAAYIEQAFRWARAADERTLLFYNDYGAETVNAKSDAIYQMVRDFKTHGVPIDGVGLQMHLTGKSPAIAGMRENIERLIALGLEVQITEFDVRLPVDSAGAATEAALADQGSIYRDITAMCLKYPKCTAIQTWGFTDKYSWVPGSFRGTGAALEFDARYQAKPAYAAMQNALRAK